MFLEVETVTTPKPAAVYTVAIPTRKGRQAANRGEELGTHTHLTDPGECRACEWQAARLLAGDPQRVTVNVADVMAGKRYASLESVMSANGELPLSSGNGDPQAAYDTPRDAARVALRRALAAEDSATLAVMCQVRAAMPEPTPEDVGDAKRIMRRWAVPSGVRADMKATRRTLEAAYAVAASEASEALRPDRGSADRWAVRAAAPAATYAGPVAHYRPTVPAWVVSPNGETVRGETAAHTAVYAETVRWVSDPDTGGQVRECERLMLPLTAAQAVEPAAFWAYGTGWRPDRGSTSADRFALKRRPTDGEHADPLAPIAKPSNRKRKRDGAVGGPMTIGHR